MIKITDLTSQYNSIKDEVNTAISRVLTGGKFILGEEVGIFEKKIAEYLGVKYCVGVASGTDSLFLSLAACGIKAGDEVITTPFTFVATVESIVRCGATPVFVDIDPETFNIDPAKIKSKLTGKTKVILPVHLYGQPADMMPILDIANRHGLVIVEDCAQSFGADYNGQKVGSLGDVGCLSFFPSKILGSYGDGGMVVTNISMIADRVRLLRNHGGVKNCYSEHGINSRLDELQAVVLSVKLRYISGWIAKRRENAKLYDTLLKDMGEIQIPNLTGDHVYNYYTIRVKGRRIDRDKLMEHLLNRGISTSVYYPLSLHLQEVYKALGYTLGDFPESELAQEQVLSLPMYPELQGSQIEQVVQVIRDYYR